MKKILLLLGLLTILCLSVSALVEIEVPNMELGDGESNGKIAPEEQDGDGESNGRSMIETEGILWGG